MSYLTYSNIQQNVSIISGSIQNRHRTMPPDPRRHSHRYVHLRVHRYTQGCDPDPQEPGCHDEVFDVHAQAEGGRRVHCLPTSGTRSGTNE